MYGTTTLTASRSLYSKISSSKNTLDINFGYFVGNVLSLLPLAPILQALGLGPFVKQFKIIGFRKNLIEKEVDAEGSLVKEVSDSWIGEAGKISFSSEKFPCFLGYGPWVLALFGVSHTRQAVS